MSITPIPEAWIRFDAAIKAINQARAVNLISQPDANVLEALEALAADFCGPAHVDVIAVSGETITTLEFDVSAPVAGLCQAAAEAAGHPLRRVQLVRDGEMLKDGLPLFAQGIHAGQEARVTLVLLTVPCASHIWDFRSAGDVILEKSGHLAARLQAGAHCTEEGVVLDGNSSHVLLDTWEWGGPTSFEVLVKYNTLQPHAVLFDIGNGGSDEIVALFDYMRFEVFDGGERSLLQVDMRANGTINVGEWVHFVATTVERTMALYINGSHVRTIHNGNEARVMTRRLAYIGRACWGNRFHLDGTIAQLQIWNGTALNAEEAKALYAEAMANTLP